MMGSWGATSYIIGNIIGSGIFITPTSILNNVQSVGASLLVWIIAAVIATLGAFCYVELGTSIRKSGGDFAYLCHVRWFPIAFSFMSCASIFTNPGTMAIQMQTFSEYVIRGLKLELDESANYAINRLISFSCILLLFFLNCFSIRGVVARFQMLAMIAKVIASGIIIIVGLWLLITKEVQSGSFRQPFANTSDKPGNWVLALFAGLFSYDGWDILNFGAEDVKKPHRSMPFAIIVGMSTVAALYLAMNVSYFVVLSVPEVQSSNAIAMTFAERTLGGFLQYAMPFLVCIVLIGSLNATLFQGSRYIWASARERHFPSFISCINRQHDSPRAALFVHVVLSMAFSFLGNLEELISYVAFTHWIIRSCTMLALLCIKLQIGAARHGVHEKAIRVPLVLPVVFLCICLALVIVTIIKSFRASVVGLLILGIGLLIYAIFIWPNAIQRFAWYRRFSQAANHSTCVLAQIAFNGNIELIGQSDHQSAASNGLKNGDGMALASAAAHNGKARIRPTQ
ncbi:hypothetical protein niasHS_004049 [Heterodera schachtii]|uniref:Amino acid transporter n=1 Tax=Heterodera schachtii TaxID=97005 RepID=A0ABD2JUM0_HETSC